MWKKTFKIFQLLQCYMRHPVYIFGPNGWTEWAEIFFLHNSPGISASLLHNKALSSCVFIFIHIYMLAIAGQTAGPNRQTFFEGTHGWPGSNVGLRNCNFLSPNIFFIGWKRIFSKSSIFKNSSGNVGHFS